MGYDMVLIGSILTFTAFAIGIIKLIIEINPEFWWGVASISLILGITLMGLAEPIKNSYDKISMRKRKNK